MFLPWSMSLYARRPQIPGPDARRWHSSVGQTLTSEDFSSFNIYMRHFLCFLKENSTLINFNSRISVVSRWMHYAQVSRINKSEGSLSQSVATARMYVSELVQWAGWNIAVQTLPFLNMYAILCPTTWWFLTSFRWHCKSLPIKINWKKTNPEGSFFTHKWKSC